MFEELLLLLTTTMPAERVLRVFKIVSKKRILNGELELEMTQRPSDGTGALRDRGASEPEDTTILLDHPVTLRIQWGASR